MRTHRPSDGLRGSAILTDVEAVVLTGGASLRMGADKASLAIDGEPMAARTARSLGEACAKVTILGKNPIAGFAFQPDTEPFAGPRRALDLFKPDCPFVFVASCDMPFFQAAVVRALRSAVGESDGVIPRIDGFLQPLCGLYRADGLGAAEGEANMVSLVRRLNVIILETDRLASLGIEGHWIRSFNTHAEFSELVRSYPAAGATQRRPPENW